MCADRKARPADRSKGPSLGPPGAGAKRAEVRVPKELEGERLDKALAALVDGMSRSLARKTLSMGAVYVGKKRVRAASRAVRAGDLLTATWHPNVTGTVPQFDLDEVSSDASLIVINKPAGQLVAGTELGDVGSLQYALNKRYGAHVRLMHRLDRPASGLLVAARTKAASAALTPQFREHTLERTYVAVAAGSVVDGPVALALSRQRRRMAIAAPDDPDAIPAKTVLKTLAKGQGWTLLAATLHTGRTHQIRLHVRAQGAPLFGDRLYGGPAADRLALHAAVLGFTDDAGTPRRFVSPPPPDFWACAGLQDQAAALEQRLAELA